MGPQQKPPRSVEARNATTQNPATLIFGHGYGADADGFISTCSSSKDSKAIMWVLNEQPQTLLLLSSRLTDSLPNPNYPINRLHPLPPPQARPHPSPSSPSALPPPHPANLPPDTEDSDESESESEIWDSVDYIDAEVSRGVPAHRIVAGGLSQGCAVSLVLGRAARYRGQLGGRRGGLERVFAHGATGVERARGVEKGERAARGDGEGVLGAWDEGYDGSGEDV
ncbi:lysophospholipase II [Marssonina coronariae]|uniref:Lysophospholipase II n=1 Tax=Diplocarpon coronariae TaxID=2795749 RepID=A0A218ZFH2_9HELO|nr:lysophospholipase II [Marssonina coronariae]